MSSFLIFCSIPCSYSRPSSPSSSLSFLLSSIVLSLRHCQPLLHLQPALPPGPWSRSKPLSWREASLLHPPSWSWSAEPPVQPLLPRQGDHSEASSAPTAKVTKTRHQLHLTLVFSHASSVALQLAVSVCQLVGLILWSRLNNVNNMDYHEVLFGHSYVAQK